MPSDMKNMIKKYACARCRALKVSCNKERPCERCIKKGLLCEDAPRGQIGRPTKAQQEERRQREQEKQNIEDTEELVDRLMQVHWPRLQEQPYQPPPQPQFQQPMGVYYYNNPYYY